jgi:hypothetical protein
LNIVDWKMYMIFGALNGVAFIHMFLTAPETKGKSLEEMDDVFDSGRRAWQAVPNGSRLDQIERDIENGRLKVSAPSGAVRETRSFHKRAEHIELSNIA